MADCRRTEYRLTSYHDGGELGVAVTVNAKNEREAYILSLNGNPANDDLSNEEWLKTLSKNDWVIIEDMSPGFSQMGSANDMPCGRVLMAVLQNYMINIIRSVDWDFDVSGSEHDLSNEICFEAANKFKLYYGEDITPVWLSDLADSIAEAEYLRLTDPEAYFKDIDFNPQATIAKERRKLTPSELHLKIIDFFAYLPYADRTYDAVAKEFGYTELPDWVKALTRVYQRPTDRVHEYARSVGVHGCGGHVCFEENGTITFWGDGELVHILKETPDA